MKNGIYHVIFESNLSSFGEGIVVVSDGKVHGGDIGFTCRGYLKRHVMELSVSQYNCEIPSALGVEGDYQLSLQYEKISEEKYYFTGHVKGDKEKQITASAVFLVELLR
ncbi:nucleoside transporter [Salmonella enterica]|uniref:GrlR family regulatory protein n=1 Tax=Salmonella TaxID=590 RepID=UPI00107BAC79|nr:nucleoside transporter [Salmonella enterica subsp. enterica serovar Muenchen]EAN1627470.1 nucleoside transporter [Salmonella enterica]EBH8769125.1 nucleoside transporter [Salmonella enterica subsp. enterica serovar Freetown]EBS3320936.1 nucleoside transporter [Salmonella enterica subsp. enterica serovar Chester]EBU9565738.1 nucleoside transporter [Salmonella enterica subsp. enterica serovar London]EBY8607841.1 nucleoside transporter [Salmonella enterica subsp. enterica serovar Reading]EBZ4